MKSFSFIQLTTGIMAFLAMVVTSDLNAANAGNPGKMGSAKIQRINGSASYTENGKSGLLKPGMELGEGAEITTGPGSQVQVWLGENGELLQILENTTMSIETLRLQKTSADTVIHTQLNLKKGGLIGSVKKLSKASSFDVKYAEGVAGIRGTSWAILPGGKVICTEGSVTVTFVINGVATPVTIHANESVSPPQGNNPPSVGGISKGERQQIEKGTIVLQDGSGTGTIKGGPIETKIFVSPNTTTGGTDTDTEERPQ